MSQVCSQDVTYIAINNSFQLIVVHSSAVTSCRLHHLPFRRIDEIEEKDAQLVLRLYKLLSHMVARQQQVTIGQLGTLHSIMTSSSTHKPIGRLHSSIGK